MGGTKGYRSYRGRTSKGKIALAVLLVLIILAAVGFLWLQEYIVYDRDGSFHLELPWKTETPPAEEEVPPEDVEITIQEPEKPKALAAFSASAAPLTQAGWKDAWLGASVMSAPAYNAAAVTLKDSTGHIYFAATGAAAGTVSTAEDTAAALAEVAELSRGENFPLLYGCGSTTGIAAALEKGRVTAIAAVNVFSAGYLAVEAAASLARHEDWTGAPTVAFSVVRQETMYESDNQKLLFPVT